MFSTSRSVAFRSSKPLILFTICMAMFSDGFTYGIVTPVVPFLLQDENLLINNNIQLTTSLLIAAFSMADFFGAPLCAWYVDRTASRRLPWYLGIVLITAGSILFGTSTNIAMLMCSRILHGLSPSILYTVGLAVLVDTIDKDEVGRWMGTAMSCNNIGIIISPLLGGIVYDKAGKNAVFGIMLGLGAIDIVLRVTMKEQPRSTITFTKSPISTATLNEKQKSGPNVDIVSLSSTPNSESIPTLKPARIGRFPGIIALLRQPRLLAAMYGVFINETIIASLCATLPLFVHNQFHWTALPAGLLFLCIAIPAFGGPIAGALSDRFGARWIAVTGFVATAPLLVLLRLVEHDTIQHKVVLCVLLTLAGSTVTLFLAPLGAECSFVAEEASKTVGRDLYASSFSLMNCALAFAGLLGPMAAAGLMNAVGWSWMTVVLGCFCATGIVPCALVTGNQRAVKQSGAESISTVEV
ncbi:MFS general substrate transporter [Plenodomus tracheiphilus IPT5]|uniref:MFS general substrate transporter n=1 Tax=Plenodomus tracheiphilus IPT5 TaxID=1408161 RepID=A0A6A7B385_9PLEO|nr:MFS general substrate transporter [Plenodomus tracheiphilus IPT5]